MKIGFALSLLVLAASTALGQDTQKEQTPPKTFTTTIPAKVMHWASESGNDLYPTCLAWEKLQSNGGEGGADTVVKGQTCYSFIMGVINAYPAVNSFPDGTTNEQIVDVVILYLKEHPAERGKDAWMLILRSEQEAFHIKWLLF